MKLQLRFTIALLFFGKLNAQEVNSIECSFLEKSIQSNDFKEHFYVCEQQNSLIVIVDTNGYFLNCELVTICNVEIKIKRETPVEMIADTAKNYIPSNIIFVKVKENKDGYNLFFFQPSDNASMIIHVSNNENKIAIINKGVF